MASKAIGFLNFKFGADLGGFDRAMKKAQKNLKRFGKNIQRTGENLTTGLTLPILGLGAASLKLASDFEETDTKFKQVFSSIEEKAENTAKSLSDSFGLSNLAAKQLLSDTGDLLVGFGFTEDSALDLSKKVNELAVDLASFTNFAGGSEGASRALTKALVGETESAKALGIVIRQGTKEYKERTVQIMQEKGVTILQAKALNNLEIAVSQSGKAIGDFQRTQDGFANQVRITKGELTDAAISLGEHLLPMAQKAIGVFRGLVDRFNSLSASTKESIVKWGLLVAAIGPFLIVVGKISLGLSALIPIFKGVAAMTVRTLIPAFKRLFVVMMANPIFAVIGALTALGVAIFSYVSSSKKAKIAAQEQAEEERRLNAELRERETNLRKIAAIDYNLEVTELKMKGTSEEEIALKAVNFQLNNNKEQLKKLETGTIAYKIVERQVNSLLEQKVELEKKIEKARKKRNQGTQELTNGIINEKKEVIALNIELAHTKKINEDLIPKKSIKSFEEISGWVTQLTFEQELFNASMGLFGDVLTSSLDSALNSQEKFFDVFIKNIKRAIQSLLVQLAVMTLIQSLTGGGKAAFSLLNIKENLGSLLNIPAMADGGVVMGPQLSLIGEAGPEAVIPLDQLKNFGGAQQVEVVGKISGTDIFLSNRNTGTNRQRSV